MELLSIFNLDDHILGVVLVGLAKVDGGAKPPMYWWLSTKTFCICRVNFFIE